MGILEENRDLDVKIGTPAEAKWQEILTAQKDNLVSAKVIQKQAEVLIKLCIKKIKREKEKFK